VIDARLGVSHRAGLDDAGAQQARDHGAQQRRVLVMAGLLVAAATAWRAWWMRGTWFYLDDLPMLAHGATDRLTVGNLMSPYVGHLMPGGRAVTWVLVRTFHMDYLPFAAAMVVLFALAGAGMVRLLVVLFGKRPGILPPLAVFLFSPLLTASTLWWAAGVNQLPALVSITWGTAAHVAYLRSRRLRDLVATVAWIAFGLAFTELALLTYVFIAILTVVYFCTGNLTSRYRQILAEQRRSLVTHAAVVAGYFALYSSTFSAQTTKGPHPALTSYFVEMGAKGFASAAIGGPLSWVKVWSAQFEVHPSGWFQLLAWLVLAGILLAAEGSRTRSVRAAVLPLTALTVQVALMYVGRAVFGPALGLDVRYLFDLAPAFALFLGLAFLPVVGSAESASKKTRHWFFDDPRMVAAALFAFVVLSSVSTSSHPLRYPVSNNPKPYFTTVRSELADHSGPLQMANASIPPMIFSGLEARYGMMLKVLSDRITSPVPAIDDVWVTDAHGHLEPLQLKPVRREDRAGISNTTCPFAAMDGRVDVPLDGPVMGYGWTLQIAYTSSKAGTGTISVGGVRTRTRLPAGQHVITLPGDAQYGSIRVSGIDPETRFCVQHVTMGTIQLDY
jgi:hypothetical protein